MSRLNPAMMNKEKWKEKTVGAIRTDIDRRDGLIVGYGITFFDPFASPDEQFSFTIRLAHSKEYMDEETKTRLEKSIEYIMMGVQKIMNVDKEEIQKWVSGEDEDDLSNYIKTAKLH